MEDGFVGWDEIVNGIVKGVVSSIRREYFMGCVNYMREIGAASECARVEALARFSGLDM